MKVQFDKNGKPIITDELANGYLDRTLNPEQRGLFYRALKEERRYERQDLREWFLNYKPAATRTQIILDVLDHLDDVATPPSKKVAP